MEEGKETTRDGETRRVKLVCTIIFMQARNLCSIEVAKYREVGLLAIRACLLPDRRSQTKASTVAWLMVSGQ